MGNEQILEGQPALFASPKKPQTMESTTGSPRKMHGRAFFESIGSPKFVLAPMVDQSEFVSGGDAPL
jgi:hypothetical protein